VVDHNRTSDRHSTKRKSARHPSTAESKSRDKFVARAKIVSQCQRVAAGASGAAGSVLHALMSYQNADGYCWPLASSLKNDTKLSRNSVFLALNELESLGIIDRRMLTSRVNGRNAPTLYRIGGKVTHLPGNAERYILANERKQKSSRRRKGATYRKVVHRKSGDVPETGTGVVPKSGTGVVPETGTQKLSMELPPDQGTGGGLTVVGRSRHESRPNTPEQTSGGDQQGIEIQKSEPWTFIGADEAFGHKKFRDEWVKTFNKRKPTDTVAKVMERCLVSCQDCGIKSPPEFIDLKHKAERTQSPKLETSRKLNPQRTAAS
jgi:hypothetical protein